MADLDISAALAGEGSVSARAELVAALAAALAGEGSLAARAALREAIVAALAGEGSIAAVGQLRSGPRASLVGAGALSVDTYTESCGTSICTLPAIRADEGSYCLLPRITATSIGFTGSVTSPGSSPTLLLPAIIGTGTGDPGKLGSSIQTLPAIIAVGGGPGGSAATLPAITGTGTGVTGALGSSIAFLPRIVATGAGTTAVLGSSSVAIPFITATGTALGGNVGVSSLILLPPVVVGVGLGGQIGSSSVILPAWQSTGISGVLAVGTSVLVLPRIIALGRGEGGTITTYYAAAMHTETMAVTTYESFPFNSLAVFNGAHLAAGDSGLFLLEGADDDGVVIAASARFRITDFDSSFRKRVPRVYVGGRFTGDMVLRVVTDEAHTRDYPLRSTGAAGLHGNHVKIGKGVNSRYWQFEVQNTEGCDFDIDTVECKPVFTRRRIGGRDA